MRTGGSDDLRAWIPHAYSNSAGKYALPFFWEAVDIGKVGEGFGTASVYARNWRSDNTYTYKSERGKVYLTLDIKKLMSYGYSAAPNSLPDAANIAKDFFASYKDILPAHGSFYPSTPILSTELFGLMGRIDIALDA